MKWIGGFFVALLAVKLLSAATPRPVPVINLDAGAHTITQNVFCGADQVVSIDTYVDGIFQFTTYLPPAPPTGWAVK